MARSEGGRRRTHCHMKNPARLHAPGESYDCANVAAHRSVVIVRNKHYCLNRASSGQSSRHVSRSNITTNCPACLVGLCERSLRTVVVAGTSPATHLQELHPQGIWILLFPAVTRRRLTVVPTVISRNGYFSVILPAFALGSALNTRAAPHVDALYSVSDTPKKPLASVETC